MKEYTDVHGNRWYTAPFMGFGNLDESIRDEGNWETKNLLESALAHRWTIDNAGFNERGDLTVTEDAVLAVEIVATTGVMHIFMKRCEQTEKWFEYLLKRNNEIRYQHSGEEA